MEVVTMPQLGETVTEGTIIRWLKGEGDPVAADEALFEVSTDKVDTEVPSVGAGFVRRILVAEGATVPIGTPVAVVTPTPDEPLDEAPLDEAPLDEAPLDEAPLDEAPLDELVSPTSVGSWSGQGPRAPRVPSDAVPARGERTPTPHEPSAEAGFLSPVVRRLLAEHELHPHDVVGTGLDGRITRNDVLAAAANRQRPAGPSPAAPGSARTTAVPPATPGPDDEVVELSRARIATAANMVASLATAAHTLVATEVDYSGVEPVRKATGLSYLPFVARAVVDAIAEYPHVNASMGDGVLVVHRPVHLGIAVDVAHQALVVPVVRDAGGLRLQALADAISSVAARAKAKRLVPDDLSGGTFSITNVGAYGTTVTAPIINQPQVAILSTDAVRMRPVAVEGARGDWGIAVRPVGGLSLSFDHRAFDGAYAAAFLARVRDLLQERHWTSEV